PGNGHEDIEWSKTVAYGLFPGVIRLNLSSRWPGGTLSDDQASSVVQEITEALRAARDERTGLHPVKVVLDRDDLAMFGQRGELSPDLMFCLDRGYETATRLAAGAAGDVEFEITTPYREPTSGHGSFFPASPSARTLALLAGPAIGPRALQSWQLNAIDLAPTIAAFLGIDPPLPSDGRSAIPRRSRRRKG